MNRRELIRRGPMALLGIGAVIAGVKTATSNESQKIAVTMHFAANDQHIIKVVKENYERGGEIREAIRRDQEWGL